MKRSGAIVLTAILSFVFSMTFSISVFAETTKAEMRVVNISEVSDKKGEISDVELLRLAKIKTSEDEKLFPGLKHLRIKTERGEVFYTPGLHLESGKITFSGIIEMRERLEFVSLQNPLERSGKYDIAVISPSGKIERIDKEIIINYEKRTIKTFQPIEIGGGDVLLVFVRDYIHQGFGDDDLNQFKQECG
jgi:hypothetical protein